MEPSGFKQFVEAASKFLPTGAQEFIKARLEKTKPNDASIEAHATQEPPVSNKLSRFERMTIYTGISVDDRQAIHNDLKNAFDEVRGNAQKTAAQRKTPAVLARDIKKGFVHAGQEIAFKAKLAALPSGAKEARAAFEKSLSPSGRKLFEPDPLKAREGLKAFGDYAFTNDASDPKKIILLVNESGFIKEHPIKIDSNGYCKFKLAYPMEHVKAGTEVISSFQHALSNANNASLVAKEGDMSQAAKETRNEFIKAKQSNQASLFEPNPQNVQARLQKAGDFVFTPDTNDPSKVLLFINNGVKIEQRIIQIDAEGLCKYTLRFARDEISPEGKEVLGTFEHVLENAGRITDFIKRGNAMPPQAQQARSEFVNAKGIHGESRFEPHYQTAMQSLNNVGDFMFTNDESDPSKMILLRMTSESFIQETIIEITSNGECRMDKHTWDPANIIQQPKEYQRFYRP